MCRTSAIECEMPASQHTQGQELQHQPPQQNNPAGCHESQQLEIVSLPQLPSWPAKHSKVESPLSESPWHDRDSQQGLVTASGAALEFCDISYWLPARQPSLRQRLAQLRSSTAHRSSSRSSSLGLATHASQQQRKRLGKQLLVSVSGVAHAGRLLAVMGPSGG
jgi:hypothetical protein